MPSEILAQVTRGPIVESSHRGWIVISNAAGDIIHAIGNSDQTIYSRSTIKPFQILPLLLSGASKAFHITSEELAIMCSSHSGQQEHITTIQRILNKIGLNIDALNCGSHPPLHEATYHHMLKEHIEPTAIHNNCSGKHTGMLATTVFKHWKTADYLKLEHPIQKEIRQALSTLSGLSPEQFIIGTDGCSAPNYALPINALARAFAQLANPQFLPQEYQQALNQIKTAMQSYPFYVGGDGRFDSELMKYFPNIVAKVGAQGTMGVSILDSGIGVMLKIEDGDKRARASITLEILKQLGIDLSYQTDFMAKWYQPVIKNHQEKTVGQVQVAFKLK